MDFKFDIVDFAHGVLSFIDRNQCLDVGCNWNKRKQTCKGGPTVTSGKCEGTASPVVTCTAVCVINGMDEMSCSDGIDNDCDGLVDCADPDCAPSCVESDCSNGLDDDGDNLTDCDDPDCASSSSCVESNCSNGVDDDGDTFTDCDDPDCEADPYCQPSCLGRGASCGRSIPEQCCTNLNLSCKGKTCK